MKNHIKGELKALALRPSRMKGCPFLSLVFNIVLEVLAKAIRQKE